MLVTLLIIGILSALAADWNGDTLIGALARLVFHLVLLGVIVGLVGWYYVDPVGARSNGSYWATGAILLTLLYWLGGFEHA